MSEPNLDAVSVVPFVLAQGLPEDHPTADCPECQHALRPTDATAAGRTWPVVDMPGLDPWLRRIEVDDTPEPVDAPSEARPWLARGDNHRADDAGEAGMSDNYFTPQIEGHPHTVLPACVPAEWIRCPQCGWPGTVEGRCGQCGLDYDYDDGAQADVLEDQS